MHSPAWPGKRVGGAADRLPAGASRYFAGAGLAAGLAAGVFDVLAFRTCFFVLAGVVLAAGVLASGLLDA
jgi:hypothetical protein